MLRRILYTVLSLMTAFGGMFAVSAPALADTCVTDATRAAAAIINPDTTNWETKRVCLVSARSGCLPSSGSDDAVLCCPPTVPGVPEAQSCPADTTTAPTAEGQTVTQTVAPSTWIPSDVQRCMQAGNCTLDHIVRTGAAFANFLFGISGAIFLLTFVYGGFLYLTAGGSGENVKKAQKMLTDATIGMILIFGASTMIRFVHKTITPPSRCESEQATRGYACQYVTGNTAQERQRNGGGCLPGLCDLAGQGANIMCCPLTSNTTGATPTALPGNGPTGTCRCGTSTAGDIAALGASENDINAIQSACQGRGGTFDRAAKTCVGPSTQADCTRLNDSSSLISCNWSP